MADDVMRTRLLQALDELRPAYQRAEKNLDDGVDELRTKLYRVHQNLGRYKAEDEPSKAIYILAACYTELTPFAETFKAIENFKEAHRKLEEYDRRKAIEDG